MNFAARIPKKGGFMILLITSFIISCGTIKDGAKANGENLLATYMPVVEYKQDTPVKNIKPVLSERDTTIEKVQPLITKTEHQPTSVQELRDLNIQWQKAYLLLLTKSRPLRNQKDLYQRQRDSIQQAMNIKLDSISNIAKSERELRRNAEVKATAQVTAIETKVTVGQYVIPGILTIVAIFCTLVWWVTKEKPQIKAIY